MNARLPVIGQWYLHRDSGRMFEVVSVDAREGIEIQDYDGNLDEVDLETWQSQPLDEIDQPQDLTGAYELADPDDADGSDEFEPGEPRFDDGLSIEKTWRTSSNANDEMLEAPLLEPSIAKATPKTQV